MADKLARRCDGFREFGLVFGAAARVRRGDTSGSWERSGDHLASAIPRLTTASRPATQDLRPSSRATTARRSCAASAGHCQEPLARGEFYAARDQLTRASAIRSHDRRRSTRDGIEARRVRCRERRGRGSLRPVGPLRELGSRSRECAPHAAPRLTSLSLHLTREREAGVRGSWVWPRTIANTNAPTSLSNLLLLGLHGIGGSTDEVDLPGVGDRFSG